MTNSVTGTDYGGNKSINLTINTTTEGAAMPTPDTDALHSVLIKYAVPDPSLVSKLKKNWKDKQNRWHEMELDYVGHAEITRILIEIDPAWNWEPIAWEQGRPAISIVNGNAEMWIHLTVLGKTVLGVGTAPADKNDVSKELIGDALRNAAMRLGIALSLWSKAEWDNAPPATEDAPIVALPGARTLAEDPVEWCHHSMLEATSLKALDVVAGIAKQKLSEQERAELRPVYIERKKELEAEATA